MSACKLPTGAKVNDLAQALTSRTDGKPIGLAVMAHVACIGALSSVSPEAKEFVLQQLRSAVALIEAGRWDEGDVH